MSIDFPRRGWMPDADSRQQSPNYTPGRDGETIAATSLHITDGTDSRGWFMNPKARVSATFLIRRGKIHQFVSLFDKPWTNGLTRLGGQWYDPDGRPVTPSWARLQTFHGDPNALTVSIEREGRPHEVWPQADIDALIRILRYVAQETGLVYVPHETLIGHSEISPIARSFCPGPHVQWDAWAALANGGATPQGLTFRAAPRISPARFRQVLEAAHSPAAGDAERLYAIVVGYGIDPAVALAFYGEESSYGTEGIAVETLNWGNVRTAYNPALSTGSVPGPFATYASWADSLADWCERILGRYIAQGLSTVELAVPVYAPAKDHNRPAQYIAFVVAHVAAWQRADGTTPAPQLRRFRVAVAAGAKVRQAPTTQSAQAGLLPRDREFLVDVIKEGAPVAGYGAERRWLHMSAENPERDLGFVFAALCEEV